MKPTLVLITLAALSILCGCGKTETVKVMSSSWNLGQHFDCLYDKQNIYCFSPSMKRLDRYFFEGWTDKSGKAIARRTILFGLGPDIVHYLERHRDKAEEDEVAENGSYETHFSTRPPEYSLWDCYRTGTGQPAIECKLTKKPDRADRESIRKKEESARLDDILVTLHPEAVIKRCGPPQQQLSNGSPTLFYPSTRPGISIKLWFSILSNGALESIETTDPKNPDGSYPPAFWIWMRDGDSLDDIPKIVQELPCLKL